MRTVSWTTHALTILSAMIAVLSFSSVSRAQYVGGQPNPYYFNNQSYNYGLQLPQVPMPNGQDEIRAADGTSCRSSMASNNAYVDVGGIGGQDAYGTFNSGTLYGRVIVPLGTVPARLDCSTLYNLEIERLRHELDLVRSGLSDRGAATSGDFGNDNWAKTGWGTGGAGSGTARSDATHVAADQGPRPAVAQKTPTVVSKNITPPQFLGGPDSLTAPVRRPRDMFKSSVMD